MYATSITVAWNIAPSVALGILENIIADLGKGNELPIEDAGEGLLIKVIPKLEELAKVDAKIAKPEEFKREVEKLRKER